MKKLIILVTILLMTLSVTYSNDFTPDELILISKRMKLYHLHTNIIANQNIIIDNQEKLLKENKKKNILAQVLTVTLSFISGGIIGITITK